MIENQILNLLGIATLLPLASSLVVIFMGKKIGKPSGWFAFAVMTLSFVLSVVALLKWYSAGDIQAIVYRIPWIPIPGSEAGWLYLGLLVDGLTLAMMVMVTGVAALVHLYSIGYMEGDKRFERFFAYLSLFTFSMLGIIVSNSIMQLFVFWELVGLASYLLIGFWFEKRGPQLACKKAFVMNRVGDMGFLVGFGILFYKLSGNVLLPAASNALGPDGHHLLSMFDAIKAQFGPGESFISPPLWLTVAGIGLFCGAIGKSAQFPLHTWLPDAMEGPTPVSSIVHSATMVAAGVYLTARIYPILTPGAHLFIATIGLITLVMAAGMAMVMTDIKRVLAYSTLSQLGYMVLGLGCGAYSFALFHLITHAFFKCCLFQCSGSVIHAAHHEQDMRQYGGLGQKMKLTMLCYGICTLAIAGASIPFTEFGISGFYSKDGIIACTANYGHAIAPMVPWGSLFYWGPIIVAYVTGFYMARSFALTFLGKPRNLDLYDHAHEAPWQMVVPQLVLAFMAIAAAPWFMKFWINLINSSAPQVGWVQPGVASQMEGGFEFIHLKVGFAWIISIAAGLIIYTPGLGEGTISNKLVKIPPLSWLYAWASNKFFFDGFYDITLVWLVRTVLAKTISAFDKYIVDGLVNAAGWTGVFFAWLSRKVDENIVDGAVNGAAVMAQNGGNVLCATQAGRVRVYVLLVFAVGALIMLAAIISVLAAHAMAVPAVAAH